MQDRPTVGTTSTSREVNLPPPPAAGSVHGLGRVEAVRIEVAPSQLPWIADEIETWRHVFEDELDHERETRSESADAVGRRARPPAGDAGSRDVRRRQLEWLVLLRSQLPISRAAAKAGVSNPWTQSTSDRIRERERTMRPVTVVGPAALTTLILRGALRQAAFELSEALEASELDVDERMDDYLGAWPPGRLRPVEAAIGDKLRGMAAATAAFVDTYLDLLAQQTYELDGEEREGRDGRGQT